VYDMLPPGVGPHTVSLTHRQRRALENLARAEARLHEHRTRPAIVCV
jgi:hypothetical protein